MNSPPSIHPRNAFKEALDTRLPLLVRTITADLRGDSKDLAALPEAALERVIQKQIEHLFAAINETETPARVASLSHLFERAIASHVPPEALLGALQTVRRHLLDASLSLLAAQVPGTLDGLRKLMNLVDESALVLHQASWARARSVEKETHILKLLAERSEYGVVIADMRGRFVYSNPAYNAMMGYESMEGAFIYDLYGPETKARASEIASSVIERGGFSGRIQYIRKDGSTFYAHLTAYLARDDRNVPIARCALVRDLTAEDQAEAEKLALNEQIIASQEDIIQKLSTPLLPVGPGVVLLPLIGAVDAKRAANMMTALLQGISDQGARVAIVDVTGVDSMAADVAEALARMASAVRLLGANVILTGIQPTVARMLTDLGINFGDILMLGTLAAGMNYALSTTRFPARSPRL